MTTTPFTGYSHLQPPSDPVERAAWFAKQEDRIAKRTRQVMVELITTSTEMFINSLTASGDMTAFDYIIQGWDEYATGELVENLQGMYLAGGVATYVTAPTTGAFSTDIANTWINIVNQTAVDYALDASNRMKDVGLTAWNNIKNNVSAAVEQGTSVENLKKLLEKNKSFSEYRAETIARTEVGSALLNGSWNGMAALGEFGPTHKVWIATADARSRETHIQVATKVLPINEPYDVGGEPMMYPHSPGASAKNVINCRCDIGYLYPGDTNPYTGETIPEPLAAIQETTQARNNDRVIPVRSSPPPTNVPRRVTLRPNEPSRTQAIQPFGNKAEIDDFVDRFRSTGMTREAFPDQLPGIKEYRGGGYVNINQQLRTGIDGGQGEFIEQIDDLFDNAPTLAEPIRTYRGISPGSFADELRTLKPGDEFTDAGYISTSMDKEVADRFVTFYDTAGPGGVLLEVISPVGTRGLIPDALLRTATQQASIEREWLLPRGARLRVLAINAKSITVEVVL